VLWDSGVVIYLLHPVAPPATTELYETDRQTDRQGTSSEFVRNPTDWFAE